LPSSVSACVGLNVDERDDIAGAQDRHERGHAQFVRYRGQLE